MKLETIKDLEAVIKLCRKQGIERIKIDGVELELGTAPAKATKPDETAPVAEEKLTDEDLLFWSSAQ